VVAPLAVCLLASGFSIITLTRFGLVLRSGIVVDDGIVVVETCGANHRIGLSPQHATGRAMSVR